MTILTRHNIFMALITISQKEISIKLRISPPIQLNNIKLQLDCFQCLEQNINRKKCKHLMGEVMESS